MRGERGPGGAFSASNDATLTSGGGGGEEGVRGVKVFKGLRAGEASTMVLERD